MTTQTVCFGTADILAKEVKLLKSYFKMDLELSRFDYCSVGATEANSMKLLPATNKQQQKVFFLYSFLWISFNNCVIPSTQTMLF